MNDEKITCIVGAGGSGREALCHLLDIHKTKGIYNHHNLICFMVEDEFYKTESVLGFNVIPFSNFDFNRHKLVLAIGDSRVRKRIVNLLPVETEFQTIIHPSCVISEWVEIGEGSILAAGCILTCNIKIGAHSHLNSHTSISHDCQIGDYFTAAPGVHVSGNCTIGEEVYFGTGASIRDKISIGNEVVIGMGGVVTRNILSPGVYVGNPARKFVKAT